MRKLLLAAFALAIMATPALAYVQVGHLPKEQTQKQVAKQPQVQGYSVSKDVGQGAITPPSPGDTDVNVSGEEPNGTQPVPEPGTMVLASMGLIALGVASRRRRRG